MPLQPKPAIPTVTDTGARPRSRPIRRDGPSAQDTRREGPRGRTLLLDSLDGSGVLRKARYVDPRLTIPLAAFVGGLVGFALGVAIVGQEPATLPIVASPSPERHETQLEPLKQALALEREARERLEEELTLLRSEDAQEEVLADTPEEPPAEEAEGFDAAALLRAGVAAHVIERLRTRFESFELDLLYLKDQANRERWPGNRLAQERRALREELRNEVGDQDYDAMLYAAGRKNRVVVASVLENSAAQTAGMRAGDAILQYGNDRIFDALALSRATLEGKAGQPTEIRFERDGDEERIFVPRGPIGVRLRRDARPPDTFR